jgi:hypothetical protein
VPLQLDLLGAGLVSSCQLTFGSHPVVWGIGIGNLCAVFCSDVRKQSLREGRGIGIGNFCAFLLRCEETDPGGLE